MWHDCVDEGQAGRLPERATLCRLDALPGVALYIETNNRVFIRSMAAGSHFTSAMGVSACYVSGRTGLGLPSA